MKSRAVALILGLVFLGCTLQFGCEAPLRETEVPESVWRSDHLEDHDTLFNPETGTYVPREPVRVTPKSEPELVPEEEM